jgi:hypothetical protein
MDDDLDIPCQVRVTLQLQFPVSFAASSANRSGVLNLHAVYSPLDCSDLLADFKKPLLTIQLLLCASVPLFLITGYPTN